MTDSEKDRTSQRGGPGKTRARKTSGPDGGSARTQYPARLEPELYAGLQAASTVTGASVNSLLNAAAAQYLDSDEFQTQISEAQARQAEAIRKLSGG